jgi:hypothetical protein
MISKVIRRTHMYLALFLGPWILMYALSTMFMNHRGGGHGAPPPTFEAERTLDYAPSFPAGAGREQMAERILSDLGLTGAYSLPGGPAQQGRLTILRQDPVTPRRVTYQSESGKLTIEKLTFRWSNFLERLHRRRGYQHRFALEDSWGFSVDLVIVAMVFWVLSGLWMWWEMKVTRFWGGVFALLGAGLFAFFLVTL